MELIVKKPMWVSEKTKLQCKQYVFTKINFSQCYPDKIDGQQSFRDCCNDTIILINKCSWIKYF